MRALRSVDPAELMVKTTVKDIQIVETTTLVALRSAEDDHFDTNRFAHLARTALPRSVGQRP
jgi:hypothetical protein